MFITPIQTINSISDLNKSTPAAAASTNTGVPFQSLFEDAISNVKSTNADLTSEQIKVATGQSDDLHNLGIASSKATMSVLLLVQLRDKALNAYNEVMSMGV